MRRTEKAAFGADRDTTAQEGEPQPDTKIKQYLNRFKMGVLLIIWCMFTVFLMFFGEEIDVEKLISIPSVETGRIADYPLSESNVRRIHLKLTGPFEETKGGMFDQRDIDGFTLQVYVQRHYFSNDGLEVLTEDASGKWEIDLALGRERDGVMSYFFHLNKEKAIGVAKQLNFVFESNATRDFAVHLHMDSSPIDRDMGVIYGSLILLGLYVMIVWDIVHRTFAAVIASCMALGVLALMDSRPSMATIVDWIDTETLLLVFGMMILVAVFAETGVFDYLAVYAYKITYGNIWPLIICLCGFTAIISSVLDNVTAMLLMCPVVIRICEEVYLDPVIVLIFVVIYANIGGTATPVGDPPNVIIASNPYNVAHGITFALFCMHMVPGVLLVSVQTLIQLRLTYRNVKHLRIKDAPELEEAGSSTRPLKQVKDFLSIPYPAPDYKQTLGSLQAKYRITNKVLLIKCSIALCFVVSLFFLHSLPVSHQLSLGWSALMGAILILILANIREMEVIIARIEWSTLLFFTALFILTEALGELGLIELIGQETEHIILNVEEESRLITAVLIILWTAGIVSAFVDNIPLTTMMVKIIVSMAKNSRLNLPVQPLVWALSFGACLGGNGTLIGASANVVSAGVAEKFGYKFTFMKFFKIGFPITLVNLVVLSLYLTLSHKIFHWH